jgi:hypothetical protein
MRRILFIILTLNFVICSCSDNQIKAPTPQIVKKVALPTNRPPRTDKLLITDFSYEIGYGDTSWINSSYKNSFAITNVSTISQFEELLTKTKINKYCCCPSRNFIISFFDDNQNYKSYVVEVERKKDSVMIFDYSFQFSSKISKTQWNELLASSTKLNPKKYSLIDCDKARELLELAQTRGLTFAFSNKESKEWRFYEGDFKFTISRFGKKLTQEEIEQTIRKTYTEDKYNIAFSDYYELCESSNPKKEDCRTKYTVTISSSKDFYKQFELYEPKSAFHIFKPSFLILGTEDRLDSLDIVKTENY